MNVNEIFYSIDGEGIRIGAPAVFIRLTGCNLRCGYCDTQYAFNDGKEMSIDEIIDKVQEYGCKNVTVTGGEPLLQGEELIANLCKKGYSVNVETNGSIDISGIQNRNCIVTMDYKLPSSKMESFMLLSNIKKLRDFDVLKFVCESNSDVLKAKEIINIYKPTCYIFFSPVFNKCDLQELAEVVKGFKSSKIRMQIQLHKIIWDPDERGV